MGVDYGRSIDSAWSPYNKIWFSMMLLLRTAMIMRMMMMIMMMSQWCDVVMMMMMMRWWCDVGYYSWTKWWNFLQVLRKSNRSRRVLSVSAMMWWCWGGSDDDDINNDVDDDFGMFTSKDFLKREHFDRRACLFNILVFFLTWKLKLTIIYVWDH